LASATFAQSQQSRGERNEFDVESYYKKWLNEDVIYIITPDEEGVFRDLTTNDERDQFIEQFWMRRDTDPQTAENEYKIEHYRRIMYANEKFTAGIPGWKTDRGRIYIKFGPPSTYETYPAGGSYSRRRKEGGGHTSVAPFERWVYREIEGIDMDIELEFVDDRGGGLYELTFDPQRKDDLLQVGFLGPTWDEIEAHETLGTKNKQDRVAGRRYAGDLKGDYVHTGGFETHRDMPFEKLLLSGKLNKAPEIKYKDLEAVVGTRVSYTDVPVEYSADFVRISPSQVLIPVTLEIPNSALTYSNQFGIYIGKLQIFGQVTTISRRRQAVFEDEIARDFTEANYQAGMQASSIFQKQLVLRPGLYKLELVVKDMESGDMTSLEKRLQVPEFPEDKLTLSSVILARSIEKTENPEDTRFLFGSLKVLPKVDTTFRQDQEMGFYFQVYGLQQDAATTKPNARVEFAVTPRGEEPAYYRDASRMLLAYSTHATVARIGSLSAYKPGDYELRLRVTDQISTEKVETSVPFTILNPLPN
jgi:GWxTD domain-containing protein